MKRSCLLLTILIFSTTSISALCNESQIDINSASVEELDELNGIGLVYAQRIIDARPFSSVDELINVSGIGEKTLEKIKQQGLACVNDDDEAIINEGENNREEEVASKVIYAKIESSIEETDEIKPISLSANTETSKDIKSEDNKENLSKNKYALYGIIAFCVVFGLVFLLKKRKKQNELQ